MGALFTTAVLCAVSGSVLCAECNWSRQRWQSERTRCGFWKERSTSAPACTPTSPSSGSRSTSVRSRSGRPAKLGPAFTDPLIAALPGLQEHGCSYGEPGGFIRRLTEDEGTWMGHILEHVAIELQNVAGEPVTFGKTRGAGAPGHYHVRLPVRAGGRGPRGRAAGHRPAALAAAAGAPAGGRGAARTSTSPPSATSSSGSPSAGRSGPSTMSLVRAAEERRIPWIRLNEQSLIQFGHGRFQQRIQATVTSRTSHIAVELASDKEETNRILGQPRPAGAAAAAGAARRRRGGGGASGSATRWWSSRTTPTTGAASRSTSRPRSRCGRRSTWRGEHSRSVIVESFITGDDHRMLVVNGELVAVSKRVPGHVVGDGTHTIDAAGRRGEPRSAARHRPREGAHPARVRPPGRDHCWPSRATPRTPCPADGERVFLRSTGNLSTGGTATDVTDLVHPDNVEMAVRAVKAIGLDVGGVDFLTTDITESYKDIGGAICEVNAAPGFRMHMAPSEGRPRDVAGPVIDMLFPPGSPSRIPIAAVTGTNGKTTTARMLAHIQKLAGHHVGLTTTDGVYIDGQRTVAGDMTGPVATRMVLSDPNVDVAVLEIARGGLLRAGMGVRHCDVGAVLNVKSDHLGLRGIGTLERAGQGQADRGRGGARHGRAQRRRPALPQDGRLHRGQAPLLRDDGPDARAGGRAHQGRRARRGARVGDQGPDDHHLRSRRPHPAALDPSDPGDARGPGAAQRAERDVRGGDGVQHGRSSSRTSATGSAPSTRRSSRRRAG